MPIDRMQLYIPKLSFMGRDPSYKALWTKLVADIKPLIKLVNTSVFEPSKSPSSRLNDRRLTLIYGIASVGYYVDDESLLADTAYDDLCRYLLTHLPRVKKHVRPNLLDREELRAGTGMSYAADFADLPFAKQDAYIGYIVYQYPNLIDTLFAPLKKTPSQLSLF